MTDNSAQCFFSQFRCDRTVAAVVGTMKPPPIRPRIHCLGRRATDAGCHDARVQCKMSVRLERRAAIELRIRVSCASRSAVSEVETRPHAGRLPSEPLA
eukprot:scaffold1906_cov106-Isochrysis_galbana.AAC.8